MILNVERIAEEGVRELYIFVGAVVDILARRKSISLGMKG